MRDKGMGERGRNIGARAGQTSVRRKPRISSTLTASCLHLLSFQSFAPTRLAR